MEAERYEEITAAFQHALTLGATERAEFLAALEERDPDAHGEVVSLLAHDEQDSGAAFNESDLGRVGERMATLTRNTPAEVPGEVAGYRVLEVLGQGGMGTVYLCQQEAPLERRIAVKVVRYGRSTAEALRRFDLEREALARMDHPGIARVLEAGTTEDGQPYFAMEFVEGRSLITDCDARRLDLRSRLRVFVQVLRALHHAHQRGILHRDLKPSNILVATVDGKASPRIIDFGLARALEAGTDDEETVAGQILGTPAYMSPEQCGSETADVDVRSDVYSAGVVLYELMTGVLPFDEDASVPLAVALQRRAKGEASAPRPSTRLRSGDTSSRQAEANRRLEPGELAKKLKRELDWIILRALDADRERRYGSAEELANELEAYLENRPVVAAPPSWTYRALKAVKRHRVATVAALVVLASLITATVVSMRSASKALAAEANTRELLDDVEAQNTILSHMLLSADPTVGGPEAKVIDALEQGIEFAIENYRDRPRVLTEVMGSIGSTFRELGMFDDAERCLKLALEYQLEVEPFDPAKVQYKNNGLALLYQKTGQLDLSEKHFKAAIEAAAGVNDQRATVDRAVLLVNLGGLYIDQKRYDEAKVLIDESYALHLEHMPDQKVGLAVLAGRLSDLEKNAGRIEEALPLALKALEYASEAHPEAHPHMAVRRMSYGRILEMLDPLDPEALAQYEGALRSALGAFGKDNPQALRYYRVVVAMLCRTGDADRAHEHLARMEAILPGDAPEDSPSRRSILALRGLVLGAQGQGADALKALKEAKTHLEESSDRSPLLGDVESAIERLSEGK